MMVYLAGSFKDVETTRDMLRAFERLGFQATMSEPGDPLGIDGCLARIDQADILYLSNPRGDIGKSVSLDLGYAIARKKRIYSLQPVSDPPISHHISGIGLPEKMVDILKRQENPGRSQHGS